MNKLGQGVSELHVQGKWAHLILQWPDLADYLRKNSGVKDYRLTTTACHAGPPRRNTAKEEAREREVSNAYHGWLSFSSRSRRPRTWEHNRRGLPERKIAAEMLTFFSSIQPVSHDRAVCAGQYLIPDCIQ
jgi:hypothetical protein